MISSLSLHPHCGPLDAFFLEYLRNTPRNDADVYEIFLDNLYAFLSSLGHNSQISDLSPVQELQTKPEMFNFLHPTSNGLVKGSFHFLLDMNPTSIFAYGPPLELNPIAL